MEKGLAMSVLSIVRCMEEPLHIRVLTMQLVSPDDGTCYAAVSDDCVRILDGVVKQKNRDSFVKLYDMSKPFQRELPVRNMKTRFTPYCMLRLFADYVEDIPDRILYLDNDVLCRQDFSDFYYEDIREYEFAGVLDYYGSWLFRKNAFSRDYVNSGVLLLNMALIKETGLLEKCRDRCAKQWMFMPDQSALNTLAIAKKLVGRKYNDQRHLHRDTVFQHFTTSFRLFPWIHKITVKPWQIERMHRKLKLHEYDHLLPEYYHIRNQLCRKG